MLPPRVSDIRLTAIHELKLWQTNNFFARFWFPTVVVSIVLFLSLKFSVAFAGLSPGIILLTSILDAEFMVAFPTYVNRRRLLKYLRNTQVKYIQCPHQILDKYILEDERYTINRSHGSDNMSLLDARKAEYILHSTNLGLLQKLVNKKIHRTLNETHK